MDTLKAVVNKQQFMVNKQHEETWRRQQSKLSGGQQRGQVNHVSFSNMVTATFPFL